LFLTALRRICRFALLNSAKAVRIRLGVRKKNRQDKTMTKGKAGTKVWKEAREELKAGYKGG